MSEAVSSARVENGSPEAVEQTALLELPFDQYQRYRLIQESIESIRWKPCLSVLDVSKSPQILDRFLPNDNVVVADLTDQDGSESLANEISLAFEDAAFDLVVTSEGLPHIPPGQRRNFLAELARIAREAVIIGAPFDDPAVVQSEEVFRSLIWARYGEGYEPIGVHRPYGLPSLDETQALLRSNGFQIAVLPNGYLHRWLVAVSTFFLLQWRFGDAKLNATANTYYNSNFYRADNRDPGYRKLLIATRTRDISGLRAELCSETPGAEHDGLFHLQILNLLVQTLTEGWSSRALEKERGLQIATAQLAGKRATIESLIAQVGERQSVVVSQGAEIAEWHGKVLSLTAQVAERQNAAESLVAQLAERHETVLSLTEQLAERQNAVNSLWAQVIERDENVRVLMESLTEQERTANLLREELRTKSRFPSPFSWLFKKRDQQSQ